jgi:hypothetical protein
MMVRRILTGVAVAATLFLASAPAALADPPGPTNYQSEVVEIEPPTEGFEVDIIGGDSFVMLRASEGVSIEVIGYAGEPYLRFLPDGTVEENSVSPAKYLNQARYGGDVPDGVDAAASPIWEHVASDGTYAWHDHRTHWMNPMPPPGLGPGDQVAEGVVPLLVDGTEVDVTIASLWVHPPSALPVTIGITLGMCFAIVALRRRSLITPVALSLSLAACATGVVDYLSVPRETVPSWTLWVLPVTGLILVTLAAGAERFGGAVKRYRSGLLLIATMELVAWGIAHWAWLWAAILPTALPFWIDRLVAGAVLIGAIGVTAAAVMAAMIPAPHPLSARRSGLRLR